MKSPLPIQLRALKATLLENKHVLGAARTGSGKTLAYAIPIIDAILRSKNPSSQLKQRICKDHKKREDFELIDGEMVSIEDMIVDKLSENGIESECDVSNESVNRVSTDCTDQSDARAGPEALVLVPTRELAVQVKEEFDKLTNHTSIESTCIIGGINQDKQVKILSKRRPQVIIATPGRLYDMMQSDTVDYVDAQSIASIRFLVIDEADRMVQKGHFDEVLKLVDTIKESNRFRQGLSPYRVYLFSATLTFLHELPDRLKAGALATNNSQGSKKSSKKDRTPIDPRSHNKKNKIKKMLTLFGMERSDTRIIDLNDETSHGRPTSAQLSEFRINCLPNEKDLYLYYFLMDHPNSRSLIFCNSKDCLRRLSNVLKFLGFITLKLHSEMDQKKRLSNLERFRSNSNSIMIATDVAARGLDIKDLDCVVHYQVPKTCESYIHRSGRTARVFHKGISLTLCEPKEVPHYRRLCSTINGGQDLDTYDVDVDLKDLMKPRVQLAQQCDKLDHKLRESKSNQNWFSKAAKECEIELDEDDLRQLSRKGKSKQQNQEDEARDRRHLNQLNKSLQSLIKRPLVTRGSLMRQTVSKINKITEND